MLNGRDELCNNEYKFAFVIDLIILELFAVSELSK